MVFRRERHLHIRYNSRRNFIDTNSVPEREHLLLLYSDRRILLHPVVLNGLGLGQSHSGGGSGYTALPWDRQRPIAHSDSESIGGNRSLPIPMVLRAESNLLLGCYIAGHRTDPGSISGVFDVLLLPNSR